MAHGASGAVEAAEPEPASEEASVGEVDFVREDRREMMGHTIHYRIHRGPDAGSAKAFLREQTVDQGLLYRNRSRRHLLTGDRDPAYRGA